MAWRKSLEGALISGIMTICLGAVPLLADGRVTGPEGIMLLGFFVGGVGLYLKEHKSEWDGIDRRQNS